MTISSLSTYTAISPNKSNRTQKICKITPHHMSGNLSIETCGNVFAPSSRQASSNYGIGSDGRIGCYVPEEYRAWTSSNKSNDQQAITIEVANSYCGGDWPVSDAAWNSLVNLCVDICQRYGFTLDWNGTPSGSLTVHKMFADTDCPGPYLYSRMGQLANEVNARLGQGSTSYPQEIPATPAPTPAENTGEISGGTYKCVASKLNIRTQPTVAASSVGAYTSGQTVNLDNWSTTADGYVWGRYTAYSGSVRYVAVRTTGGKEYLAKEGEGVSQPTPSTPDYGTISGGTYTVRADKLNVRTAPSTSAEIVASYSRGGKIYSVGSDTRIADGYVWAHYTGNSGNVRWVAMGPTNNPNKYLSK